MFFANNEQGIRVYIEDAEDGEKYFCPACNELLIMKRGEIVTHHFAHKAKKNCDPWYKTENQMSEWHKTFQNIFPRCNQERVVWNSEHTEFHIADVLLSYKNKQYVFEFQHSPISRKEFDQRSRFYLCLGYSVVWIFDFCDCESKKRILYEDIDTKEKTMDVVWPGKDRVRFLDKFSFLDYSDRNQLKIFFHVLTGLGKEIESEYSFFEQTWCPWEYVYPKQRERFFIKLSDDSWWNLYKFKAHYNTEESFFKILSTIAHESETAVSNP